MNWKIIVMSLVLPGLHRCDPACVAVRLLGRPKATASCSLPTHDDSGRGWQSLEMPSALYATVHFFQSCLFNMHLGLCTLWSRSVTASYGYVLCFLKPPVQVVIFRCTSFFQNYRNHQLLSYLIIYCTKLRSRFTKTAFKGKSSNFIALYLPFQLSLMSPNVLSINLWPLKKALSNQSTLFTANLGHFYFSSD